VRGAVFGTHWHGLLDNDDFRRAWLTRVASAAGRRGFMVADDVNVAARRDAQLDLIAELLAAHLDVDAVLSLLDACPVQRPHVAIGLREPAKTSRTQTDRL
jgi:adenosylcobyric acid synthase